MAATHKMVNGVRVSLSLEEKTAIESEWADWETNERPLQEAKQANETSLRTKVLNAIGSLETADANWNTLTNAEKDAAVRLAVRGVAKLGRIVLNRTESD